MIRFLPLDESVRALLLTRAVAAGNTRWPLQVLIALPACLAGVAAVQLGRPTAHPQFNLNFWLPITVADRTPENRALARRLAAFAWRTLLARLRGRPGKIVLACALAPVLPLMLPARLFTVFMLNPYPSQRCEWSNYGI